MSNNIDERIVQMRFDNKDFDKNVKATMRTMSELNSSMDMSSSAQKFNKSMNSMNENTGLLTTTMDKVGKSWSAWEIIAITAISNITNRVIDLGIRLAESLSVDQIATGWEKFGELTKNTATLIAQGLGTDEVNANLEKLLWFSDATSYSFTDMTNNISKFTAAGQNLEDSTTAIMGIANWAALAGQNASTASRAMYQISQAMSTGTMRYQDWKSIQNANMDTVQFREQAVKAAIEAGQLYKEADDTYRTLEGKEYSLSQLFSSDGLGDLWFNADVMMATFKNFSSAVEESYKIAQESGVSAYEAIEKYAGDVSEMTDEDAKSMAEFGLTAFQAAQECRTLADAINAIKDAVSSEFMKSFKLMFGDLEEAKQLWGDVYDSLETIFLSGSTLRNNALKLWKDLGGRDDLFANTEENMGALFSLLNTANEIFQTFRESFYDVFFGIDVTASDASEKLANVFKQLTSSIKKFADNLNKFVLSHKNEIKNIIKIVFNGIKVIINVLKIGINLIKSVVNSLKPLTKLLGGSEGILTAVEKLNTKLEQFNKTSKIFAKVEKTLTKLTSQLADSLIKLNLFDKLKKGFDNMKKALLNNGKTVDALKKIWSAFKTIIIKLGNEVIKVFPKITRLLGKGFAKSLNLLAKGLNKIVEVSSDLSQKVKEWKDKPKTIERWNKVLDVLSMTVQKVKEVLSDIGDTLSKQYKKLNFKKIQNGLKGLFKVLKIVGNVVVNVAKKIWNSGIVDAFNYIKDAVTSSTDSLDNSADKLSKSTQTKYKKFVDKLRKHLTPLFELFKSLKTLLLSTLKVITSVINLLATMLNKLGDMIDKIPNLWDNSRLKKFTDKFKNLSAIKKIAVVAGLILLVKMLYDIWSLLDMAAAITDSIYAFNQMLRAKAFFMIARGISEIVKAITIMAITISILGKLNTKQLNKGIKAFGEISGTLILFLGILLGLVKLFSNNKVLNSSGETTFLGKVLNNKWKSQTTAMTELGRTILYLSAAMKKIAIAIALLVLPIKWLGEMKDDIFEKGFDRLGNILGVILLYLGSLILLLKRSKKIDPKNKDMDKYIPSIMKSLAKSLTTTIAGMIAIAFSITRLGKLNSKKFSKGFKRLISIFALIASYQAALTIYTKILSKKGSSANKDKVINAYALEILAVTASIVFLTYSLERLAKIDEGRLMFGVVMLYFIAFFLLIIYKATNHFEFVTKLLSKVTSKKSVEKTKNSLKNVAMFMLAIAAAMASLSVSIFILKHLKTKDIIRSASIILGLTAAIAIIATGLDILTRIVASKTGTSYNKKSEKSMKDIVKMSYAMVALVSAFSVVAVLSDSAIKKASTVFIVITGCVVTMFTAVKLLDRFSKFNKKKTISNIVMLSTIVGSLVVLSLALTKLSKSNNLGKASLAMAVMSGVMLASLVLFKLISKIQIDYKSAIINIAAMVALSASIFTLALAFTRVGSLNWKSIGKAAAAMGIMAGILLGVAALAAVIGLIPGASISIAAVAALAAGIGIALLGLATALDVLNKIDVDTVIENLNALMTWFIENTDTMISFVGALVETFVGSMIAGILGSLEAIIDGIGKLITGVLEWLAENAYSIGTKLLNVVKSLIQVMIDDFSKGKDSLGGKLLELADKILNFIATDVMQFLGRELVVIGPKMVAYLLKGIYEGLKDLANIGKYVAEGIWKGIKSMGSWLISKLKGWVKDVIPGPICKVLGIHSPSRLMAEYGGFVVQGLANGINDESDIVEDSMTDVANTIADSVDDNFTITPVLDLTEIQNGTKKLSSMLGSSDYSVNASMANSAQSSLNNTRAAELRAATLSQQTPASAGENITLNNVFNITGETDPNEIADAVSKKIAEQISRRKTTWQ